MEQHLHKPFVVLLPRTAISSSCESSQVPASILWGKVITFLWYLGAAALEIVALLLHAHCCWSYFPARGVLYPFVCLHFFYIMGLFFEVSSGSSSL